jgi:hypothetical protein
VPPYPPMKKQTPEEIDSYKARIAAENERLRKRRAVRADDARDIVSAVLADCKDSLAANPEFHTESYDDRCYCMSNLGCITNTIVEIDDPKAKKAKAIDWAEIILRNNASTDDGVAACGHKWCSDRIAAVMNA